MTETLINKKAIFSTEHIMGMDITETKTKEQTFTDLILGTEETNKDATETQGNSNNAITFKQKSNNHQNNESEEIGDTMLAEVLTLINCRT